MRITALLLLLLLSFPAHTQDLTARDLVQKAMDHWRGLTSYGESTMTIHRPDWERSMSMKSWSKGDKISLVRVTAPAKDAGNGTLLNDSNMWTYTPKINRVIKVPSSMMSQSWMGSDFSNKDIAKSTDIIDQYDHELTAQEEIGGHIHYTVTSIPHEDAAVVWGRQVLKIRDDNVLVEERYYDQDDVLVKTLATLEISEMGGRSVAARQRMSKEEQPEEWTEISVDAIEFDIELGDNVFTLSNLRNPRQ